MRERAARTYIRASQLRTCVMCTSSSSSFSLAYIGIGCVGARSSSFEEGVVPLVRRIVGKSVGDGLVNFQIPTVLKFRMKAFMKLGLIAELNTDLKN